MKKIINSFEFQKILRFNQLSVFNDNNGEIPLRISLIIYYELYENALNNLSDNIKNSLRIRKESDPWIFH